MSKWFAGVEAFGFLNCVLNENQLLKDAVEFALLMRWHAIAGALNYLL